MLGAFFYTLRLATRNPDVTWRRGENPEPWQEYRNKQYKVELIEPNDGAEKKENKIDKMHLQILASQFLEFPFYLCSRSLKMHP